MLELGSEVKLPQVWGLRGTKRTPFAFFKQTLHLAFLLFLPTSSLDVFWNMRGLVVPFVYSLHHLLSCFIPVMSQRKLKEVPLSSTTPHSALIPYQRPHHDTHTNHCERYLLRVAKSRSEKLEKATTKLACLTPLCMLWQSLIT